MSEESKKEDLPEIPEDQSSRIERSQRDIHSGAQPEDIRPVGKRHADGSVFYRDAVPDHEVRAKNMVYLSIVLSILSLVVLAATRSLYGSGLFCLLCIITAGIAVYLAWRFSTQNKTGMTALMLALIPAAIGAYNLIGTASTNLASSIRAARFESQMSRGASSSPFVSWSERDDLPFVWQEEEISR